MLLVLAGSLEAQPILSLPEISVESSRLDAYLPARTEVSREELVESRKSDLTSVLDLTPGINVRAGGRGEARLDLRGYDQRAVLFTLNGVPVYEPYNGIINLNLFPIDMLGGVEITRGASSPMYGPNGMAGTVKMTTFGARPPVGGSAQAIWRDADFWDLRAAGVAARGGLSGLVGGRYLTTPGFPLSSAFSDRPGTQRRYQYGDTRENSDREETSVFANLGYRWTPESRVHATVLASFSNFGIPPTSTQFLPQFRRNDGQDLIHAQAGVDHRLWPRAGVAAGVFYTGYRSQESLFDGADYRTRVLTTDADSGEIGGIARYTMEIGGADTLAVGTLVRGADATVSNTADGTLSEPSFVTTTLAAENVFVAAQRLALVLGLSWDLQTGGDAGTDSQVNPQGGVSADFGAYGQSRVAIGRKVRFPTLRELYDPLRGNPELDPEASLTFDLGHHLGASIGYLDINLYRAHVDDLIQDSGGEVGRSINLQDAILQGVELAVGAIPTRWIRAELNYTYLDARARDPRSGDFTRIQHRPANRFNGILRVDLPYAFWFRLEGLYASDQVEVFGSGITIPDFGVVNLQITREFAPCFSVFAGVDNVLDADFEERLGTPQPGRWVFAGLRATYP